MKKITWEKMDTIHTALRRYYYDAPFDIETIEADSEGLKEFGINWGGCGTQTAARTRDFIKDLEHAVNICEKLNELELSIDYDLEEKVITDRKSYNDIVKSLLTALESGYFISVVRDILTK